MRLTMTNESSEFWLLSRDCRQRRITHTWASGGDWACSSRYCVTWQMAGRAVGHDSNSSMVVGPLICTSVKWGPPRSMHPKFDNRQSCSQLGMGLSSQRSRDSSLLLCGRLGSIRVPESETQRKVILLLHCEFPLGKRAYYQDLTCTLLSAVIASEVVEAMREAMAGVPQDNRQSGRRWEQA